ncbi:MAG: hypothetical protein JWM10_1292 [Myxococcaceae bacterium]|nr:hypothetical protein [Myxococcaceae bacterium]
MHPLAIEYQRQYRWRDWPSVYARIPLDRDQTVLDLGCAVGDQSRALADLGASVVGIDGNADLLAEARRLGGARVEYLHGDLGDLAPLSLPRVDGLWLSFVAAYFPDLPTQLRHWSRWLAPGGWVALVEADDLLGHTPLGQPDRDLVQRFYAQLLGRGAHDFHAGRKLCDHAVAAGLTVEWHQTLVDEELSFEGPAAPDVLHAWAQRFDRLKVLERLCGDDYAAFRARFLRGLADPEHRSSARVHFVLARAPK